MNTEADSWSVSVLMLAVAVLGVACVALTGWAVGDMGAAVRWAVVHVVASVLGGVIAGAVVGPNAAVGGHLGVYNVASPVVMWLRVRWLRENRVGFLSVAFFPVAVGGYGLGMLAAWLIWRG